MTSIRMAGPAVISIGIMLFAGATDAGAQDSAEGLHSSVTFMGEYGHRTSDRHYEGVAGLVGLKAGYSKGGSLHHYFSFRAAVVMGMDLICVNSPDGCLNAVNESALVTATYEPRWMPASAGSRFAPYVGARGSIARGWDGIGAGVGVSYGLQVALSPGAVIDIGGATERFFVAPAGPDGNGRDHTMKGFQLGAGWRF